LLLVSWGLLHVGFWERHQIVDTPVYQRYGEAMVEGEVPYRDFAVEYPPGALPAFVLPSLASEGSYRGVFEWLMWACGAAAIAAMAFALAAVGADPERLVTATAFAGIAPLFLGSVVLTRFDLWPGALTAVALALLLHGRPRLGLAVLGVAVSAKAYPVVLLPLALAYTWRRRGRRDTGVALAVFLAVFAAIVVPFAVLSSGGVWGSFHRQAERPLQIESLASSVLLVLHRLHAYAPTVVSTFGSQNLAGSLPDAVATAGTILQLLAIATVWALFFSRRGSSEALLAASAAAVASLVAFGKVLSPQFAIWLVPLVPLVAWTPGLAATALLAASLVLTQAWFPARYWNVVALGGEAWLVLARNLVLVALFAVLAVAIRRVRGSAGSR
jgi:hypothetical protein